jgi:hypothetical protein
MLCFFATPRCALSQAANHLNCLHFRVRTFIALTGNTFSLSLIYFYSRHTSLDEVARGGQGVFIPRTVFISRTIAAWNGPRKFLWIAPEVKSGPFVVWGRGNGAVGTSRRGAAINIVNLRFWALDADVNLGAVIFSEAYGVMFFDCYAADALDSTIFTFTQRFTCSHGWSS